MTEPGGRSVLRRRVYHKCIELRKYDLEFCWDLSEGSNVKGGAEGPHSTWASRMDGRTFLRLGRSRRWVLCALSAVVDVEEFERFEDRFFFAGGTATRLAVGGHVRTRDDAEGVAMGLFESFRGDRAMRKFETALGAAQHPTGHLSALVPGS